MGIPVSYTSLICKAHQSVRVKIGKTIYYFIIKKNQLSSSHGHLLRQPSLRSPGGMKDFLLRIHSSMQY